MNISDITIHVSKAEGDKCHRCWHITKDCGSHKDHPNLCLRCTNILGEMKYLTQNVVDSVPITNWLYYEIWYRFEHFIKFFNPDIP
jgi:hypothetical protein